MKPYKNGSIFVAAVISFLSLFSCTKLDTPPQSELTEDLFPKTSSDFVYLTGPVYTSLRAYPENIWNPQESATDEMTAPTRGSDWGDGGKWRNMHYHTFNPNIDLFGAAWTWGFGGIATTNGIISIVKGTPASPERDLTIAELQTMRSFYYFILMDMFGNIPIILDTTRNAAPPTRPRTEVWNFIVSDLTSALPFLSTNVNQSTYGRPTKYLAEIILAKMYLNAPVYIGSAKLDEADAVLNDIITSGKYALEGNPLTMFRPENGPAVTEAIFSIPYDATIATGANHFSTRTLHPRNRQTYNLPYDPWNGFCTLANFYDSYSASDNRANQWLIGPQRSAAGNQLFDGNYPVNFTKALAQPDPSDVFNVGGDGPGRSSGVRNIKYFPDSKANSSTRTANNDYLVFRFSDAVLMKAEVELRKGGTVSSATLGRVNTIRSRAGVSPYAILDLDELYNERGREFSWESWRRNDMIRFGHWEDAFGFNPGTAGQTHKRIFPIPSGQLAINPGLRQNPGYQ
ncbi:MAG: RagB/SusD family nutrient uptake outer membrane protein [Chitinophagaceae bacterium]